MKVNLFAIVILGSMIVGTAMPEVQKVTGKPIEIYRYDTNFTQPSHHVEIETMPEGTVGRPKYVSSIPYLGYPGYSGEYVMDGLGSNNIKIIINKIGYTEYAGLKFYDEAVVAISQDGIVELDREGIYASDSKGRKWVSKKLKKCLGPEKLEVADCLNELVPDSLKDLVKLNISQDSKAESLPIVFVPKSRKSEVGIAEKSTWEHYTKNGVLAFQRGDYVEALKQFETALQLAQEFGEQDSRFAASLNNLAEFYKSQLRYPEAETFYRRTLLIQEKSLGPENPDVAGSLVDLAEIYMSQGNYAEAEPLLRRSLAIREKSLKPENPDIASSLNNLALLLGFQGRYVDAEPLYRRALAIVEKALGPEHPDYAINLDNLALLYEVLARYAEAAPLHERALAIREKALPPQHPAIATSLSNLATNYDLQGRYAEVEPLFKRQLAMREKALGSEHPDVATTLANMASFYFYQDRYADAEPLIQRALAINEKALGSYHERTGNSLGSLASLYDVQGRYVEAEPLHQRALAIHQKVLGSEHPKVARHLYALAYHFDLRGRYGDALPLSRRATTLIRRRIMQSAGQRTNFGLSEQRQSRFIFVGQVKILRSLGGDQSDSTILGESFDVAQLARTSDTAQAVAAMAARFSSGNSEFAQLVKKKQDALQRWKVLDSQLVQAFSKPVGGRTAARETQLREELTSTDKQITDLDRSIQQRFPEYQDLTNPAPLELSEAQKLLAPQEAMLSYLVGDKESFVWLVRQDRSDFRKLEIGKEALDKTITALHRQLDATSGLQPFAVEDAYALYKQIVAPIEVLLNDVTHLIVVPDGALQSVPFGVLVSEDPKAAIGDPPRYREVAWLAKKYALSVLPSESSLRALRQFAKRNLGNQPFTGFGDPVLQGGGQSRGANLAALYSRGPIADVNEVRQLQSLPETADELYGIARTLGADRNTVHLREAATETNVKRMDLTPYRNLAFSTHGLLAGDFKGLAEPALVLTPPGTGTELDDGLLTASEAAQLKPNADWVILSACNTAAPDGAPGAEGLSGLARAFFYAGSRALLVSHWPVDSNATVALTTGLFKEAAANPGIGKAEALRRSILALMNSPNNPEFGHPSFWAPFVVVGEGGVQSSPQGLKKWLKTIDQLWRNLISH